MFGLSTWTTHHVLRIGLVGVSFAWISGCRSLAGPQDLNGSNLGESDLVRQAGQSDEDASANPIVQVAAQEPSLAEQTKQSSDRVVRFFTGREQENPERAKELYREADQVFKQATQEPSDQRAKAFARAAKVFQRAGEAAPGTALQQDALFMQAESLFFSDRLVKAAEVYEKLQKEFPSNRHIDRAAARLFSISRYWIETVEADDNSWVPINLTDAKKPRMDIEGHAIRVLDQIRYDDPTGRLADDATMAAAAEYIRQKKYEEADEFLTDLRETFTDSEHLFLAHLMGISVKLENYRGPKYSGLILEEADTLVKQTRERFPDKLAEKEYGDRVSKAAAEIAFLRAERLRYRAGYRERRKEYGAARYYYNLLIQKYPDTPHADTARERLANIQELPGTPPQRLSWLTTIFPDSSSSSPPLELSEPSDSPTTGTILR